MDGTLFQFSFGEIVGSEGSVKEEQVRIGCEWVNERESDWEATRNKERKKKWDEIKVWARTRQCEKRRGEKVRRRGAWRRMGKERERERDMRSKKARNEKEWAFAIDGRCLCLHTATNITSRRPFISGCWHKYNVHIYSYQWVDGADIIDGMEWWQWPWSWFNGACRNKNNNQRGRS